MSTEENRATIRVLVADDQQLIRDGIVSLLRLQAGLTVVGSVKNGQEAIEQARALCPDVILMDVRMPGTDGIEATAQILKQQPDCCILMLTTFDDDAYIKGALRGGARGYLFKDMPAADLAKAIIAAVEGIYQLDAAVIEHLISPPAKPQAVTPSVEPGKEDREAPDLTGRERDILRLIARGATNREVARQLFISEGTVKNHLARLFSRLGLRDRTQAVVFAREHGLL
ncbi:response regulator transcription factor [Ktedonosporobacter rubrisoli]|uniref:Response regulator transcription factor n=1 Tax=Ktedonosporobacter rubrisoli TaxID=2509675 RepID=A0A4P6JZP1_KTERU|nr:response regulator transcription factor [Ktedonosporobacter rubrisoli]QBD80973.1 response regulator transcription factor [Ktedonosporobacter rubrisoli]